MPSPTPSSPQSPRYGPPRITGNARNVTPFPASAMRGGSSNHYRSQSLLSDTGSVTQTITTPQSPSSPQPLVLRLRGHHEPSTAEDARSVSSSSIDSISSSLESLSRNSAQEETEGSLSPAPRRRRRITWAEDVIDNEGLGRKSSKVCCIYHKAREFGESSSESDDSSSSSSGADSSDDDDGSARMARGRKGAKNTHGHGPDCEHGHAHGRPAKSKKKPGPNAYEKMPKYSARQTEVKS